jgi:hypothetical protein
VSTLSRAVAAVAAAAFIGWQLVVNPMPWIMAAVVAEWCGFDGYALLDYAGFY